MHSHLGSWSKEFNADYKWFGATGVLELVLNLAGITTGNVRLNRLKKEVQLFLMLNILCLFK